MRGIFGLTRYQERVFLRLLKLALGHRFLSRQQRNELRLGHAAVGSTHPVTVDQREFRSISAAQRHAGHTWNSIPQTRIAALVEKIALPRVAARSSWINSAAKSKSRTLDAATSWPCRSPVQAISK